MAWLGDWLALSLLVPLLVLILAIAPDFLDDEDE